MNIDSGAVIGVAGTLLGTILGFGLSWIKDHFGKIYVISEVNRHIILFGGGRTNFDMVVRIMNTSGVHLETDQLFCDFICDGVTERILLWKYVNSKIEECNPVVIGPHDSVRYEFKGEWPPMEDPRLDYKACFVIKKANGKEIKTKCEIVKDPV